MRNEKLKQNLVLCEDVLFLGFQVSIMFGKKMYRNHLMQTDHLIIALFYREKS